MQPVIQASNRNTRSDYYAAHHAYRAAIRGRRLARDHAAYADAPQYSIEMRQIDAATMPPKPPGFDRSPRIEAFVQKRADRTHCAAVMAAYLRGESITEHEWIDIRRYYREIDPSRIPATIRAFRAEQCRRWKFVSPAAVAYMASPIADGFLTSPGQINAKYRPADFERADMVARDWHKTALAA